MTDRSIATQPKASTTISTVQSGLLQRQCACGTHTAGGGECAECSKQKLGLQRKLMIGATNDPLEHEADRVAEQVLRMPEPGLQRHVDDAENTGVLQSKPLVQRKSFAAQDSGAEPPASVHEVLRSPGEPLGTAERQYFEPRFGHDFSQVRVHTNALAGESARAVQARAYTVGGNIAFAEGQYSPESAEGRRLLAHELTHVVQQGTPGALALMRKGFESTVEVCHRVLESRKFQVDNGGVRVVLAAQSADTSVPNCRNFNFGVTLTRSEDWWPDKEIGSCENHSGGIRVFKFANVPRGSYYLTFWRIYDNPNCCLEGDVTVFDEVQAGDGEGCKRAKDLSTMDIVHGALDLAGFIPVLGAIPDGINAGIYVLEGDWANAGLSAVAAIPAWGDGIKLTTMVGKSVIKVEAKAAIRLGEEGLAKELKTMKAASKSEKPAAKAAESAAEKADAKALDDTFKGGKGEGAYDTTQRLARGNLGERLATEALATDGHKILSFKPDIRGTNQGGIDMLTMKGGVVYFVDNKALTRAGNVSSVSALTTNFAKNKATALADLKAALKVAPNKEARDTLQSAITAVEGGAFKRVVTNANLTKDDAILTGVTQQLRDKGIDFIDVFKPLKTK